MADDPSVPGQVAGRGGMGQRPGDAMMQRIYGDQAGAGRLPVQEHRMQIDLNGFPAGTRPRVSMSALFKEVVVSKSRQMETTSV